MPRLIIDGERSYLTEGAEILLSVHSKNIVRLDNKSIWKIGPSFCEGDQEIEGLVIGDNIKEIGDGAFADCKNLKFVIIGTGLELIEGYAFSGNESLQFVFYAGSRAMWQKKVLQGEPFEYLGNIICLDGEVHTVNYKKEPEVF